jgi:type IV secretory pathway VirB10-like protein
MAEIGQEGPASRRARGDHRVTTSTVSTRNSVAFGVSALFHVAVVFILLFQESGPYQLPTPPSPPVEMEIERIPQPVTIPPPPAVQPPTPPLTAPPVPAPTPATRVRPVVPVQSAPTAPVVARPLAAPSFTPLAAPEFTPTPAPARPAAPLASTATSAPAISRLNVHKSEKNAPAGAPTLPIAPSPAPAGRAGGGAPAIGGSRLGGLTPYGPGAMPSGGLGIRGSLVGCANADAVGLSSVERARCNERFGVDMARAPHLDGISPDKRAEFDKTVEKQNAWKAYRDAVPATTTPGGHVIAGQPDAQPQGLLQQVFPPH